MTADGEFHSNSECHSNSARAVYAGETKHQHTGNIHTMFKDITEESLQTVGIYLLDVLFKEIQYLPLVCSLLHLLTPILGDVL